MKQILTKLMSRKLWACAAGVCTGVYMIIGGNQADIVKVIGAVCTVISSVSYMIAEGAVDAARVKAAADSGKEIVEAVKNEV